MLLATFYLLTFASSLSYRKGDAFSYQYKANVDTSATKESEADRSILFGLSCQAQFRVNMVTSKGAYMEMTLSNVITSTGADKNSQSVDSAREIDEYYSRPVYFTHCSDGSIADVTVHEEDSEQMTKVKVGIVFALRTSFNPHANGDYAPISVVDTMGLHNEYVATEIYGGETHITSQYTEDDFIHFADQNMKKEDVAIDALARRTIAGDRIKKTESLIRVIFSPPTEDKKEDKYTVLTTNGIESLSGYQEGNAVEIDFPYETVEDFVEANPSMKILTAVTLTHYAQRSLPIYEAPSNNELESIDPNWSAYLTCNMSITYCVHHNHSFLIGDLDFGLQLFSSGTLGIAPQCRKAINVSPGMIGMTQNMTIISQGEKFRATELVFIYGRARTLTMSKLSLSLFGSVIIDGSAPIDNACTDKAHTDTVQFPETKKGTGVVRWIWVFIMELKYTKTHTVVYSSKMDYSLCASTMINRVLFEPKVTFSAIASFEASIVLARAGFELNGTISDHWTPTVWNSFETCQSGFDVRHVQEPYKASLKLWYQLRTLKGLKLVWGTRNEATVWAKDEGAKEEVLCQHTYEHTTSPPKRIEPYYDPDEQT